MHYMESVSDWMAGRKRDGKKSGYLAYLAVAALIAIVLLITAFEISNHSMLPNYPNSIVTPKISGIGKNFSVVQDVYQYDGGVNHTYFVGVNLK